MLIKLPTGDYVDPTKVVAVSLRIDEVVVLLASGMSFSSIQPTKKGAARMIDDVTLAINDALVEEDGFLLPVEEEGPFINPGDVIRQEGGAA